MRVTVVLRPRAERNGAPNGMDPPEIWEIVRAYIAAAGGEEAIRLALSAARIWADLEVTASVVRCVGVAGLRQVWDMPFFHVEDELARKRLVRRAATVLEEALEGGAGFAFVHVAKEAEAQWKGMLESLGAEPAERWRVPIGSREVRDLLREKEIREKAE